MSSTASRPFDADADGLIMSEGYVAVVMKTLEQALADGDPIQAVVRGLGVATDGRGKSLWAPRKEGQIKAMQRAYRSGVDMAGLQYLECHATATQLGDATELETLGEVLGPKMPAGQADRHHQRQSQHRPCARSGRRRRPDQDRSSACSTSTIPPAINIQHAQSEDRLEIGPLLHPAGRRSPGPLRPMANPAGRRSMPSASAA